MGQEAVFAELKDTLFDIIEGRHPWTRQSTISAYHPCVVEPPHHTDSHGIIIQATLGGSGGDHIMSLRGHTADHRFRELALSLVVTRGPLVSSKAINQLGRKQTTTCLPHSAPSRTEEGRRAERSPTFTPSRRWRDL